MAKVLVVGGTGFIGTNLVRRLVKSPTDKIYSMSLSTGNVPNVEYIIGDVTKFDECVRAVGRIDPEYIFYLAAQPLVDTALRSPMDTLSTNIQGSFNFLQAVRDSNTNIKGIVWISTDKVYGYQEQGTSVKETDRLSGTTHPYDASKVCSDILASLFSSAYGLPVVIIRSGNIYGEYEDNYDRIIPGTICSVIRGEKPVIRSDGKYRRNYLYVQDVIDGYLVALRSLLSGAIKSGQSINLGTDDSVSVMEIVDIILEKMHRVDLSPIIQNRAKKELVYQNLDWSLAKSLGWTPRTPIEVGLENTIRYYKDTENVG